MYASVDILNLEHVYGDRKALDDITFSVTSGKIWGCLGPNGSGKSTLFHILNTSLRPTSVQSFKILGYDGITEKAKIRNHIGVLFQKPSIDPKLTVYENLLFHGYLYSKDSNFIRKKIDQLLTDFDLTSRKNDFVETLSGGFQRRVEIAKALVFEPKLLLMDEPSTGLDPVSRREFWKVLENLKSQRVSIMLTTHFIEEADKCDEVVIFDEGRLVAHGTPLELMKEVRGDVIKIQAKDVLSLKSKIDGQFPSKSWIVDNALHIECEDGFSGLIQMVKNFPDTIESVTVSKPTLYDVFIHKTGHEFEKGST